MPSVDKTITNPGIHKQFVMSQFPQEEQDILRRLSSEWYLTNSGSEFQLGYSSTFRYFLMKATRVFSEMFNLQREIVCIFAPYDNFEPRTLDAFDYALRQYQALRIESVCRVLICKDPKTEDLISDILKNDPERPIVVPFTYQELQSPYDSFFLRNRFRNYFYTRDLFSFLSPLKTDLYFFGRSELIQDIVNRHQNNENAGLFGLRKSGKTSIVFGIERFLKTRGSQHLTIDCENPSIHKLRWNELLHRIVEFVKEVKQSKYKISALEEYTEKEASRKFEQDILGIYRSKKQQSILLIFDEIERISPYTGSSVHWREGEDFVYFWQTMRFFFQRYSNIFTYLLVGTNPACIEQPKFGVHDNPLFSSIPFQYVPAFEIEKTREMVRKLGRYMGLKFDESIYSKLTDDFGGHPFLIRHMSSTINAMCNDDRPGIVDKALYEKAKVKFLSNSRHYLDMIVDVLKEWYPSEYEMLNLLANDDSKTFDFYAKGSNYYTTHLVGYGLLQSSNSGYAFNIESMKDYLRSKNRYVNNQLTREQKIAEVSERRNSLERKLRQIIRNQLKAVYGRKSAGEKVVAALPENRREKLPNKDIDHLLHIENSPLFFLDLRNIISREWDIFKNIFEVEKKKLEVIMEDINDGRIDAHSKSTDEDQFTQLRLHFKKLENILEDWI